MPARPSQYLDPEALSKLGGLSMVARTVVEGFVSGLHASPFHGNSVEFAEYREYVPGDDLKHLDWKVYARANRAYIRRYQEETNLRATVMLDVSASMAYTSGGISKIDYARYLASSLAFLMTRQQDAVGLVIFDDQARVHLPPKSTSRHLRDMLGVLEDARPTQRTALPAVLHALADRLTRRGLVVLISDLLDDPVEVARGLRHFLHRRQEVVVLHVLDPAELDFPFQGPTEFHDLETGERLHLAPEWYADEYRARMRALTDEYRRRCREARIDYALMNTRTPFDTALREYLRARSRLR